MEQRLRIEAKPKMETVKTSKDFLKYSSYKVKEEVVYKFSVN